MGGCYVSSYGIPPSALALRTASLDLASKIPRDALCFTCLLMVPLLVLVVFGLGGLFPGAFFLQGLDSLKNIVPFGLMGAN